MELISEGTSGGKDLLEITGTPEFNFVLNPLDLILEFVFIGQMREQRPRAGK